VTQQSADDDAPRAEMLRGVSVASETARAKVNLTLEILGRRADGYHELRSLVAFADFGDTLGLEYPAGAFALEVDGPFASALGGGNLVQAAAEFYARSCPAGAGAAGQVPHPWGAFRLTKRIPVAAGLGGGSADAAAALRLLAQQRHPAPPLDTLLPLAAKLGADVPVCLFSKPAIMTGIGEQLAILPAFPRIPAVLVNPRAPLATAAVFRELQAPQLPAVSPLDSVIPAFRDIEAVLDYARQRRNDLEAPARRLLPAIGTILEALERSPGALLARLSGSGPTCFALFRAYDKAAATARNLQSQHPDWWIEPTWLG
jgi:4-diphosphocytidyl-2-C-methyl-D-erythritol kinase